MMRRSLFTCLFFATLSQLSSGCWCYRPVLWRFGCQNQHSPVNAGGPGPILSGPAPSPIFGGSPILGGGPIHANGPMLGGDIAQGAPGCANCGSAPIFNGGSAMPVSGPNVYDGSGPGMQHGTGFGGLPPGKPGYMTGPYVPPGGYPQPTVGLPPSYTGNPVYQTAPAALGTPSVSTQLHTPTAMPSK